VRSELAALHTQTYNGVYPPCSRLLVRVAEYWLCQLAFISRGNWVGIPGRGFRALAALIGNLMHERGAHPFVAAPLAMHERGAIARGPLVTSSPCNRPVVDVW